MSAMKIEAETLEAMRKAGTPPQIAYAYKRTGGLLLAEDMREHWPPDRVKEWDDAINEYFAIEEASRTVVVENGEAASPELVVEELGNQCLDIALSIQDIEKASFEPIKRLQGFGRVA
jgi:hypothetical protein